MYLEKLNIQRWRGLDNLQLELKPGLNLLHGPNESGISSLHEAIRAAFLLKSRGKGSPTTAKPWSGSGTTKVEVHFRHQDQSWRLTKVFFANGSHLYAGDKLIAKDDEVQSWLDENLADRGLATLLSVQGDIKLADVPAPLRPHLVAAETVTPGVAWLEQELQGAYETYWTPKTGGAKKPLTDARKAVIEAEGGVEAVQEELRQSRRVAEEMVSLERDCEESRQAQQAIQIQIDQQRPLLGAWESYRRQQAEVSSLQQQEKALKAWIQRWQEQTESIAQLSPQVEDWKAQRQQIEEKLAAAPDRAAIEQLRTRQTYIQSRQQQLWQQELNKLAPPTREQVKQLEQLEQRLQALQEALESSAWEAELEALGPLAATLDGKSLMLSGGQKERWKTSQGFLLELAGARLQLKPGGQSMQELEQCRQQIAALQEKLKVASAAAARETLEQAQDLKSRLKTAVATPEYGGSAEIDRLSAAELEQELSGLPGKIAQAESLWTLAQANHQAQQKNLQALLSQNPEGQLQMAQTTLQSLKAERPELDASQAPGQLGQLQAKIQTNQPTPPEGAEVSPETIQRLEASLTESRREHEHQQSRLDQLIGRLREQKDLHHRLCLAQEELTRAGQRLATVETDANSARLLWEHFQASRKELERDIVAPLRQRLSCRIQSLTQSRYQSVVMQHDFKAESLLTANGQNAPLLDLSFGTREQLAFLSRLCLAEMLSEKERNLVVFDDNLVHTDPGRLELACDMLETASQSVQVLLLTCHPERFRQLQPRANCLGLETQ